MSQKTNLNINPYYDDYDSEKNFYKVLFKPGFPVQARELTTLQSLLQGQIESFGSHIFKEGSVVVPGNISYDNQFYAVKLNATSAGVDVALYIENFIEESKEKEKVIFCDEVVSRGFQSEHGYKFYKKANDNVHVRADVEIVDDKFVWLCLSDIRFLFSKEHHLNMDMRSVLSTIDFVGYSLPISEVLDNIKSNISDLEKDLLVSSLSEENSLNSINEISEWLHEAKRYKKIDQEIIPLKSLYKHGWVLSDSSLKSNSNKNFEVVGIKATVDSREVCSWFQPIIKDNIPKVYAFLIKKINGIFHVLTKLVEEDYSWAGPELGPTLSSVDSNNLDLKKELLNFNVKENEYNVIYDRVQSEEGGRFLEQKNRYVLIVVNDDVDVIINQNYKWVTLYQLKRMTNSECCVNIEARSLLCIGSYFRE